MKKLVIYFGGKFEDINQYTDNDQYIVLIKDKEVYERCKTYNTLYLNVKNLYSCEDNGILNDYAKKVSQFFTSYGKDFYPVVNFAYLRLILPPFLVINNIQSIIDKNDVEELVLFAGAGNVFLPSFGGEGEGNHFLYRDSWFYNPIIYEHFKDSISIIWNNKERPFKIKCAFYIRELYLKLKFLAWGISKINSSNNTTRMNGICLINIPLQYDHLKQIRDTSFKDANLISYNKYDKEDIIYLRELKFGDVIDVLRKTNRAHITSNYKFLKKGIICNCFRTYLMEYLLEYKINYRTLKSINPQYVVTNMTHGIDIFAVDQACKELGIPHYNYQYVAMPKLEFPFMKMATKYFLYSDEVFKAYCAMDSSFERYNQPVIPPQYIDRRNHQIVVSIFTQPDDFTDYYLDLVKYLSDKADSDKFKFVLKLHPRQNKKDFFDTIISNSYGFEYSKNGQSSFDVIKDSDVVISITSSVIHEAFLNGKMCIIYNPEGRFSDQILKSDGLNNNINFIVTSGAEILKIITDYNNSFKNFIHRYQENFKQSDI